MNDVHENLKKTCVNCKNAIFDAWWGEYKCAIKQHLVFAGEGKDWDCSDHQNGIPTDSIRNKDYPNKD